MHLWPQLLPVEEIDPSFAPLVSVGREIANIDNLFISPSGRLVIVETKLWRNPQATREVVAQIVDYASLLHSWSYPELEKQAKRALSPAPLASVSMYEFVSAAFPGAIPGEEQFIDEVERTLRTGRFMLLIVGDGIRESVEKMLGMLNQYPQLHFTFGLVELQIFRDPGGSGGRLVLPQLIVNTKEVVRAVVKVETTGKANVSVAFEGTGNGDDPPRRRTLSEDEFFDAIKDQGTAETFRDLLAVCRTWRNEIA